MQTFNNFAELAVANGTQMSPRVIAMATGNTADIQPVMTQNVQADVTTNNGARAAAFEEKGNALWMGKGNIDPSELDLPADLTAELDTWDEDDVAAAREYWNGVLSTSRWVGKPAKARAKELLEELDKRAYQKRLPLEPEEGSNTTRRNQDYGAFYAKKDALKAAKQAEDNKNYYYTDEYKAEEARKAGIAKTPEHKTIKGYKGLIDSRDRALKEVADYTRIAQRADERIAAEDY